MPETDALIDAHHHVWLDSVLAQRSISGVDTNEQRSRHLPAYRCQLLEMPFQARARCRSHRFPVRTGTEQLRNIVVGEQHFKAVLQALENDRGLRIELAVVEGSSALH